MSSRKDDWFNISARRLRNRVKNRKARHRHKKKRERPQQSYATYIKSLLWKRRKAQFLKKFGRACFICRSIERIHVHHIVYSKQGAEHDEHLAVLCELHHIEFHNIYGVSHDMTEDWYDFLERYGLSPYRYHFS